MKIQEFKISALRVYVFIINFFLKLYYLFVPFQPVIKPLTILDLTKSYVETQRVRFLREITQFNKNIESAFYDKKEYQELMKESDNYLERSWRQRILFEYTPRGNIIMIYDTYKQGFAYYSDSYNLPYDLLNAVAMKYVSTFFCRDFFMDDSIITSPLIKIHQEVEKPKSSVVKKFSINDNTRSMKKTLNSKKETINKKNKIANKEANTNAPEHNMNRFISLGKMINFQFIKKPRETYSNVNGFKSGLLDDLSGETSLQKKVMDYKAFKNLRSVSAST